MIFSMQVDILIYKNISYTHFTGEQMKSNKTITISLPAEMGHEIQQLAKQEHRTVSELIRESFRQYRAQHVLTSLAKKGKSIAKKKGLKPKDFGGPFENEPMLTVCSVTLLTLNRAASVLGKKVNINLVNAPKSK